MCRALLIMFGFPDGMSTSLGSLGKGDVKAKESMLSKDFLQKKENQQICSGRKNIEICLDPFVT